MQRFGDLPSDSNAIAKYALLRPPPKIEENSSTPQNSSSTLPVLICYSYRTLLGLFQCFCSSLVVAFWSLPDTLLQLFKYSSGILIELSSIRQSRASGRAMISKRAGEHQSDNSPSTLHCGGDQADCALPQGLNEQGLGAAPALE